MMGTSTLRKVFSLCQAACCRSLSNTIASVEISGNFARVYTANTLALRSFSSDGKDDKISSSPSTGMEWRKTQLNKLEKKFTEPSVIVENDEDLQPMWREMEGRVSRRRPRTVQEMGGRTGRINVKRTDEEYWLKEGLYSDEDKKP